MVPTCFFLSAYGGWLAQVVGMVPGEFCPGVDHVLLALERHVFSHSSRLRRPVGL